jgi:ABC-type dipeptide/oligopeptide/nickel transport system ATPase component
MRIISLQAQNFKALRAVEITPTGAVVPIIGDNGQGKSSVLDSIYCALAGKKAIPSKPIRRGADSAVIKLDLGEVKVTRKFSGDTTSVIVEAQSGARFPSPQRMLDDLLGELSFDPLRFANAEPKAQLETLRSLVQLDVDVDALDGANARDYELRRDWNRKVDSLKELVASLGASIDPQMDTTPINVNALTSRMADASEHNALIERRQANRDRTAQDVAALLSKAIDKRQQAQLLLDEATAYEAAADSKQRLLDDAEPLPEPIDVSALRDEINAAMAANAERQDQERQRAAHRRAVDELQVALSTSQNLTAAMEERSAAKVTAIANAKMPLEELSFGDGEVLYDGVPLAQVSSAERIRVSFAIAIAKNPKLRVVLLHDGPLLDEKSLALVAQMAEEADVQVWIERVGRGPVGVLIQDGEVVAVDGVEQPQLAEKAS